MKRLSLVLVMLGNEPTHWCPGCKSIHRINVNTPNLFSGASWTWDGNAESPTFSPSINIVGHCHYHIRAGQIEFCQDSAHALAGKTVPLPDFSDEEFADWDGLTEKDF